MFCSKCGGSNDAEAKFCKSCGVQLNGNSGAQPVAVSESPEVVYAGFWRRGAALITDMLIIVPINIMLILLAHSVINDVGKVAALAINNVIGALVGVIYFALQESGTHSATIGKRAFNLKVVRTTNARLSLARAAGRYFARWMSALLLFGYFIQPFTAKRQALHDMVSDSVVVQTKRGGEKLVVVACIGGILLLMLFWIAISILVPKYVTHREKVSINEGSLHGFLIGGENTVCMSYQEANNGRVIKLLAPKSGAIYPKELQIRGGQTNLEISAIFSSGARLLTQKFDVGYDADGFEKESNSYCISQFDFDRDGVHELLLAVVDQGMDGTSVNVFRYSSPYLEKDATRPENWQLVGKLSADNIMGNVVIHIKDSSINVPRNHRGFYYEMSWLKDRFVDTSDY